jgi:UDP-glucose 4-epimerase
MKNHMISGGCGFVGRNMVKRLYNTTKDRIFFVDNLSVGTDPSTWLDVPLCREVDGLKIYGEDERLMFLASDFEDVVRGLTKDEFWFKNKFGIDLVDWDDVFHFAAIVGGRAMIDGDPMKVALDLSIDAEFFYWITRKKPKRVLYPSSSAAYPINKQTENNSIQLKESDIDFSNLSQPDMTYGWSKLTGEYLAKIAASYYGVHMTCIRPFSGYGEDQDYTYPIPSLAKRAVNKENPFEVWGSGRQGRDFVHIDDVLDCTLQAMDVISDGTAINIGLGRLTTFQDVISIFTGFAGYHPEIKMLLDKPVGVHSRYCNMDFVNQSIGWKAKISLEDGLKRVYQAVAKKEGL